jgi:hypothetical protein
MANKAKNASLIGQIIMAVWIASWSAYLFISNQAALTVINITISGGCIMASFSPVFISIILDKIKGGVNDTP